MNPCFVKFYPCYNEFDIHLYTVCSRPSAEAIKKKQKEKRAEKAVALEAKESEIAAPGIVLLLPLAIFPSFFVTLILLYSYTLLPPFLIFIDLSFPTLFYLHY